MAAAERAVSELATSGVMSPQRRLGQLSEPLSAVFNQRPV